MNNGGNDCRTHFTPRGAVRRRTFTWHGGHRYGDLAGSGAAKDRPGGRPISANAEGQPALRRMRQFPAAERLQIRPGRHQPRAAGASCFSPKT